MSPLLAIFIVVSVVAVAGGLGTVLARNVVYASLFLLLSLLSVAGIYVLLFSPFLALVQVLIYGGAIIIVILFALMLTRQGDETGSLDSPQKPLAAVAGLAAMGVLIATIVVNKWPPSVDPEPVGFEKLGATLFTQWAVPFEIASVLLLVALIGAIVIARPEDSE
ncbi:MAG: NADH-quinone oxidoreductase subunit J [Chloroflexi bacterium]|nr:NADH-quinone oxidoreductase subunit J [Chloroflexota bacterium]